MLYLNTTLLREKFIIREANTTPSRGVPMIALGNRLALNLQTQSHAETIIIRAQNMHTALRMGAIICLAVATGGPITLRKPAFDFASEWHNAIPAFERLHNKDSWVSVYHDGKPLFTQGSPHPFMDIIESCDAKNRDEYDRAVQIAEDTFKQTDRAVTIDHHTNIAAVIGVTDSSLKSEKSPKSATSTSKIRLGLILRKPGHSVTFNFTTDPITKDTDVSAALNHAANWLELIQLSVTTGFHKSKRGEAIARSAPLPVVQSRMGELNAAIKRYEDTYAPTYRPDRPNMLGLIEDTAFYVRHGKPA